MEQLQETTKQLLDRLGVAYDAIELVDGMPHPVLLVSTPHSRALIGPKGETLEAINALVRRILEKQGAEARFLIDVNRYRLKRIEDVQNEARILAERARVFQHDVELRPMNAYERMLVHATLADDPDLATESSGEGKFRRVVIKYEKA